MAAAETEHFEYLNRYRKFKEVVKNLVIDRTH